MVAGTVEIPVFAEEGEPAETPAVQTEETIQNIDVTVSASGFVNDAYVLKGQEILVQETLDQYQTVLADREIVEAFDISAEEGTVSDAAQGAEVTLTLDSATEPAGDLNWDEIGLYHIQNFDPDQLDVSDDQTNHIEKLDYAYDTANKTLKFTTKSFSPFVLAYENEEDQNVQATSSPVSTSEPISTAAPESTTEPVSTAETAATSEPVSTAVPESTAETTSTATPESTAEAAGTAEPDNTAEAESTSSPSVQMKKAAVQRAAASGITLKTFSSSFAGGADEVNGDYVWTADTTFPNHAFKYRVNYSMSGKGYLEPGAVVIRMPKRLLKDREGNYADTYMMSLPERDDAGLTDENVYVYYEDGDDIVITNRLGISAAESGYFEICYCTSENSWEYADYDLQPSSDTFEASVTLGSQTMQASAAPVYIDTSAEVTSVLKYWPQRYEEWQDSWGEKPADADDYIYLDWEVRTRIEATSKYNFSLDDDFSAYGEVVGYKYQGEKTFTEYHVLTDQTESYTYGRYDYVLTRLPKSRYGDVQSFAVTNHVDAIVDPVDQEDEDSIRSAAKTYTWERPVFDVPFGHFYSRKYGLDFQNNLVKSSEQISVFGDQVKPFIKGRSSTMGDFSYLTYVRGYPYPWTRESGADALDPDSYGKVPVTYELKDEEISLGDDITLSAEDYSFTALKISPYYLDAVYNDTSKQFESTAADIGSDTIDVYIRKGDGSYQKAAVYHPAAGKYDILDSSLTDEGSGRLTFADDVSGYYISTSNAHYYTCIYCTPEVQLKNTEKVLDYVSSHTDQGKVTNHESACAKTQKGSSIVTFTRQATDYFTSQVNVCTLKKSVDSFENDPINKAATVVWSLSFDEQTARQDAFIHQESGTFYDLLPIGSYYQKGSLEVEADGRTVNSGDYTVSTIDNYNGTGRTMLKIQVRKDADRYQLYYTTVHSWDSIKDFSKSLLNTVAYETGNDDLDDGFPDNGGVDPDTGNEIIRETDLMKDLDPDTDDNKFVYAEKSFSLNVPMSASIGLYKKVKNARDDNYRNETTVYQDEIYSYYVRFATSHDAKARNLILYDSLENYEKEDGSASDWHGTLVSVDTSYLKKLGADPVVYYSTTVTDVSTQSDELDPADWSTEAPDDLSAVTAIAVDIRRKADGSEFVMNPGSSAIFKVYMRSPDNDDTGSADPVTYNNIYMYSTISSDGGTETTEMIHQDHTTVHFRIAGSLALLKLDESDPDQPVSGITFQLKGTSDYGTETDMTETTGVDGTLVFENLEKGTYTLQEIAGTDDYLPDHTMRTVTVDEDGNVTVDGLEQNDQGQFIVGNTPRVHGDLTFVKKDSVTLAGLGNTVFSLAGTSSYGNDVLMYETSDGNGRVTFQNVEMGTYTLTETKARDGYILPSERTWKVVCDSNGIVSIKNADMDENGDEYIVNEKYHSFLIQKQSSLDQSSVQGAVFTLSGTSDCGHAVNFSKTTSSSGYALFDTLEPGAYLLKETEAPDGYRIDETEHIVIISADDTVTIDGETVNTDDAYVITDQKIAQEEVVVTKKWNDGLTGDAADSRDYPNIHIESYDPSTVTASSSAANASKISTGTIQVSKAYTVSSGTWGTCKWTLDSDGVMTIYSGTISESNIGFAGQSRPFNEIISSIKKVKTSGKVIFNNAEYVFYDFSNVEEIDLSGSVLGSKANKVYSTFSNCPKLKVVKGLENWDLNGVINTMFMFSGDTSLTDISCLKNWDMSTITKLNGMFNKCSSLQDISALADWDVSNVQTFGVGYRGCTHCGMFGNCSSLTDLTPLKNWQTGSGEDFGHMFYGCSSLTDLTPLSNWSFDNAETMYVMFAGCTSLEKADFSRWDMSDVKTTDLLSGDKNLSWLKLGTHSKLTSSGLTEASSTSPYSGKWTKYKSYNTADAITASALENKYTGTGGETAVWVWTKDPAIARYEQSYQSDDGVLTDSQGNTVHNTYQPGEDDASKIDTFVDADGIRTGYWTKVSDDTWTYTFFVFDADVPWKVWEDDLDGYESDHDETNPLMIADGSQEAIITNWNDTDQGYGSLKIEKKIEVYDEDGQAAQADEEDLNRTFAFEVVLSDENDQALSGTAVYGSTVFRDGRAIVSASAAQPVILDEIPAGYHYHVEELSDPAYTNVSISGQDGVIVKNSTASVQAVNKRTTPQEDKTSLTLSKVCEDEDVLFSFHIQLSALEPETAGSYTVTAGTAETTYMYMTDENGCADLTVELKNGWTCTVNKLPVRSRYRITEDQSDYIPSYLQTDLNGSFVLTDNAAEGVQQALSTELETIDDEESPAVSFTNTKPSYEVSFMKRDDQEGFVQGAVLQVLDEENQVIHEWTSEEGKSEKVELTAGTYTLHEKSAPDGYGKADDISFTVSPDGGTYVNDQKVRHVVMVDTKNMSDVSFRKTNGEYDLAGAKLSLLDVDSSGNETEVSTWTSDGMEHIEGLIYGHHYILREVEAPAGYAYASDIDINVSADGTVTVNGEESSDRTVEMVDLQLAQLPNTGRNSMISLLAGAGVLLAFCAYLLISRRRKG